MFLLSLRDNLFLGFVDMILVTYMPQSRTPQDMDGTLTLIFANSTQDIITKISAFLPYLLGDTLKN